MIITRSVHNNFCEFVFESNLTQHVNSPTHIRGNLLDLVLTNSPDHVTNLIVHPPEYQCATSDHYLITFTTNFKHLVSTPTTKEVFNYSKGDYNGLSEHLLSCDLSHLPVISGGSSTAYSSLQCTLFKLQIM